MASSEQSRDYEHFRSIPWCAKLMSNPEFELQPSSSRTPKANSEDYFFAKTLNTETTVSATVNYARKPSPGPNPVVSDFWALFSLGCDLNGHPGMCHGGVVACLFDEVLGALIGCNQRLEPPSIKRISTSTAYLNTTYLKHIVTPQVVLVRASLKSLQGRKIFIDATMHNAENEVVAKAESLFVILKAPL